MRSLIKNNRGQMSMLLVILMLLLFAFIIMILVGGIVVVKVNSALAQDIDVGNVNMQNVTADTWGVYTSMYLNYADWWGIALIGGMVLGLFLSSYVLRGRVPKWGIIIDIFIIITMFLISLYISATYSTLLDALAEAGETFLEDYTPKTSMFLINLPIYIVIIGVIMMVLFHSSLPRKQEEIYQSGGYLQGV
jgi:hypothetical protein